jgi:hypothetical protein
MPFAFNVWNRDVACLGSPRREGCREVVANTPTVTALSEVSIECSAPGVIQNVVSFGENLRLSLATVHDVSGNKCGEPRIQFKA